MSREQQQPPNEEEGNDDHPPPKQQQEAEYRRNCRKFYRQSTSFVSDDSGSDDEDGDHKAAAVTKENRKAKKNVHSSTLIVEAVDCLTQGAESYQAFLSALAEPDALQQLRNCGLPTNASEIHQVLQDATALQRLIAIRTEERKLAHERNMQERLVRVHETLLKVQQQKKNEKATTTNSGKGTTQHEFRHMQKTLKQFVSTYTSSCVASHPLLAGMRHLLETQLQQQQEASTMAWTLDAAVLSEAVVAQTGGAQDTYIQDAVTALTTFLVWIPAKDEESDHQTKNDNSKNTTASSSSELVFAIHPSLSDRTLDQILRMLPSAKDLHGRPTGRVHPMDDKEQFKRTNVDGEFDEPFDLCTQLMTMQLQFAFVPWW